jgi:lipooligosaccharide transport system ATP-binding protein
MSPSESRAAAPSGVVARAGTGEAAVRPPVVEAQALSKRFGESVAVDDIAFVVREGECCGFLGPNGAGKTTTVRMISCVSPLSGGEIRVFGLSVAGSSRAIKANLGVCPQEDNLDPDFSVLENLTVYARYFGIKKQEALRRADELLDFLQLKDRSHTKIRTLSGGMKRRLLIARALINRPRLLLLDEPTTGLDPQARHLIWQRIRALKKAGTTILLTTHYMEEASQLCDRVIFIDKGKVIVEGSPEELIRRMVTRDVVEIVGADGDLLEALAREGAAVEQLPDRIYVYTDRGDEIHRLVKEHFSVEQCLLRRGTLEDVFLKLTGRELREP